MAKSSKYTKKCRAKANFFGALHFICFFGPLLFFVPYAFAIGEMVSKIALGLTATVSVILIFISFIVGLKYRAGIHRSIIWLLIVGVLFCIQNLGTFIWIMAVTSILDELIFSKLYDHYSAALLANKEMDKRGI